MKKNSLAAQEAPAPGVVPKIAGVQPTLRRVPAGGTLFCRGGKTFGVFFLAKGRLRMQRVTPDGSAVILHVARPGETLAEASLFAECYQCDVIAEADAEVWYYPKDDLTHRLRDDPAALWDFAAGLARSLHRLRLRYELKQIRSAPDRVLQLLRLHCDDAGVYHTTGALKDMAAELGLTHEALYRALAKLEKNGAIVRAKEHLQVIVGSSRGQ